MIVADLHSWVWAHDLHQYIPNYTRKVHLRPSKHGNWKTVAIANPYNKGAMLKCGRHNASAFNRAGECISHPMSRKAIAAGAEGRQMKITNIRYESPEVI